MTPMQPNPWGSRPMTATGNPYTTNFNSYGAPMQPGMQPTMQPGMWPTNQYAPQNGAPMQPTMQPGMQPTMQPTMQPNLGFGGLSAGRVASDYRKGFSQNFLQPVKDQVTQFMSDLDPYRQQRNEIGDQLSALYDDPNASAAQIQRLQQQKQELTGFIRNSLQGFDGKQMLHDGRSMMKDNSALLKAHVRGQQQSLI